MSFYSKTNGLISIALAGCALSGCTATKTEAFAKQQFAENMPIAQSASQPLINKPSEAGTLVGGSTYAQSRAVDQANPKAAMRATKQWFGSRTLAIQSDEVLPPVFQTKHDLNFEDVATRGRVSINVVAERLGRITGVPVRVKQDVFSGARNIASAASPMAMPMPSGGPIPAIGTQQGAATAPAFMASTQTTDVNSIEMRWNGSLSGFLDHLTGVLGLSWSYRDGVVMIERMITESFEIAALQGSQDYKFAMSGSSSGSSGSNNTSGSSSSGLDISESGRLAALQSLTDTVKRMMDGVPESSAVLAEGSGSIVVTTTKDMMGRVRSVIQKENAAMLRTVQLQFDIYSVTSDDASESGVNWNVVFQSLSQKWGATLGSPATLTSASAGVFAATILSNTTTDMNARFGGSSAVMQAMAENKLTAQHRPLSMLAMNRQWARKTNLKQTGYLAETTPAPASSAGAGGLPGLKTGTVTTGDTFVVQPAILDNNTVILKFGVGLTDLLGLFDVTTGSGTTFQKVQTPDVSGTNDQTTVPLKPGQVLVLTGMSRIRSGADVRSLSENTPVALGGSRKGSRVREDFVIFVRAVLM